MSATNEKSYKIYHDTPEIRELKRQKNKARREYQRYRDPQGQDRKKQAAEYVKEKVQAWPK